MEEDYSKAYLERTENGEESMLLLRIGSDIDATMIQSFLFSENISSLCLNQNINRTFVTTLSPIKIELYILKTDYSAAKEIIENFAMDYKGSLRLYDTNGNEITISVHPKNKTEFSDENSFSITGNTKSSVETTAEPEKINSADNQKSKFTENFFSFDGICTLRKYWIHFLISILIAAIDYVYSSLLYKYTPYGLDLAETIICIIALIFWNIHILCLSVQRFRSVGENPWKLLIPIYGPITVKFIPAKEDQTNNKYLNYKIPGERWLRVLLIVIAILYSGGANASDSIQSAISGIQKNNANQVVFSDENVTCKKFNDEDGISYNFNIFRYNDTIVDTVVFYDSDTLKFLKAKYNEFKKADKDNCLNNFCDFIYDAAYDYPYVELYDSNGDSIIYFKPEEYVSLTNDVLLSYEPSKIRYCYYDFDDVVEELK